MSDFGAIKTHFMNYAHQCAFQNPHLLLKMSPLLAVAVMAQDVAVAEGQSEVVGQADTKRHHSMAHLPLTNNLLHVM